MVLRWVVSSKWSELTEVKSHWPSSSKSSSPTNRRLSSLWLRLGVYSVSKYSAPSLLLLLKDWQSLPSALHLEERRPRSERSSPFSLLPTALILLVSVLYSTTSSNRTVLDRPTHSSLLRYTTSLTRFEEPNFPARLSPASQSVRQSQGFSAQRQQGILYLTLLPYPSSRPIRSAMASTCLSPDAAEELAASRVSRLPQSARLVCNIHSSNLDSHSVTCSPTPDHSLTRFFPSAESRHAHFRPTSRPCAPELHSASRRLD